MVPVDAAAPFSETRLFGRGVSDPQVRAAVEQVRHWLLDPHMALLDEPGFWAAFGDLVEAWERRLDAAQAIAFEIAVDTLLTGAGLPTWTVARQVAQRQARAAGRPVAIPAPAVAARQGLATAA